MVKKALKQLYFLKKQGKFLCQVLVNFYTGAIESILTGNNWHGVFRAPETGARVEGGDV